MLSFSHSASVAQTKRFRLQFFHRLWIRLLLLLIGTLFAATSIALAKYYYAHATGVTSFDSISVLPLKPPILKSGNWCWSIVGPLTSLPYHFESLDDMEHRVPKDCDASPTFICTQGKRQRMDCIPGQWLCYRFQLAQRYVPAIHMLLLFQGARCRARGRL